MTKKALLAVTFAAALASIGCKQGRGDRCQINEDCEEGLLCIYPGVPNSAIGGQCEPTAALFDAGLSDRLLPIDAPEVDASAIDAPTDATMMIDAEPDSM
jgi:hypothetical protein